MLYPENMSLRTLLMCPCLMFQISRQCYKLYICSPWFTKMTQPMVGIQLMPILHWITSSKIKIIHLFKTLVDIQQTCRQIHNKCVCMLLYCFKDRVDKIYKKGYKYIQIMVMKRRGEESKKIFLRIHTTFRTE